MEEIIPYGYVYLTTNLINNKKYIGQHKSTKFDSNYLGSGLYITKAIAKYGKDNFSCSIIEWCYSIQQLNEQEEYWILFYNAVEDPNYYNISARVGPYTHTQEHIEKLRVRMLGNQFGLGHTISENLRQKFSRDRKGWNWFQGRKHSEKTKALMSEQRKGHPSYESQKLAVSKALKGKPKSEETKKKMSENTKGMQNRLNTGYKIICIETQQIFGSINQADEWLKSQGLPHNVSFALKNPLKNVGGYHWANMEDQDSLNLLKDFIGKPQESYRSRIVSKVKCIETQKIYSNCEEASKDTNTSSNGINGCLRGLQKSSGGFHWEAVEE